MKKGSILLAIGMSAFALSPSLLPAPLGAQEVGENLVVLLPAGKLANPGQVLVVTGKPKAATKVGTCKPGDFYAQDANVFDRQQQSVSTPAEGKAPTPAEVIVIDFGYRNQPTQFEGIELAPGTRLGSFGGGGRCGPGYQVYTAHILAQ